MITGWGMNTRIDGVHYFSHIDGMAACRGTGRRRSKCTIPLPHWNPDNPMTCPVCKKKAPALIADLEEASCLR
jgi:hypothetical protein